VKKALRHREQRALACWAQTIYQLSERQVSRLLPMTRASLRYQRHRDPQAALRIAPPGVGGCPSALWVSTLDRIIVTG